MFANDIGQTKEGAKERGHDGFVQVADSRRALGDDRRASQNDIALIIGLGDAAEVASG